MKIKNTFFWLMIATPILGVLGALLRWWLYATGMDIHGLLIAGHPAQLLTWVMTLAAAVLLVLGALQLKGKPEYQHNFPPSALGAIGYLLAAAAAIVRLVPRLHGPYDTLNLAVTVLCGLSAIALAILAWLRYTGKKPSPLLFFIICAWLMVDLVMLYRLWSATPQIQNYCFSLLANVCVMLSVYYTATFAADMGNRQMHTLFHLLAAFFCLISLPKCDDPLYYALICGFMMLETCPPTDEKNEEQLS